MQQLWGNTGLTSWGTIAIQSTNGQTPPVDYTQWIEFIQPYDLLTIRAVNNPSQVMHLEFYQLLIICKHQQMLTHHHMTPHISQLHL